MSTLTDSVVQNSEIQCLEPKAKETSGGVGVESKGKEAGKTGNESEKEQSAVCGAQTETVQPSASESEKPQEVTKIELPEPKEAEGKETEDAKKSGEKEEAKPVEKEKEKEKEKQEENKEKPLEVVEPKVKENGSHSSKSNGTVSDDCPSTRSSRSKSGITKKRRASGPVLTEGAKKTKEEGLSATEINPVSYLVF